MLVDCERDCWKEVEVEKRDSCRTLRGLYFYLSGLRQEKMDEFASFKAVLSKPLRILICRCKLGTGRGLLKEECVWGERQEGGREGKAGDF